jgi:hypothetical protein
MEAGRHEETSTGSCAHCGGRLAHDQRYCLECGERRGPLPPQISHLIGAAREQGRPVTFADPPQPEQPPPDRWSLDAWIKAPRAAAAAVIGMLGFGVVVGSAVGGSIASPLRPLLVLVSPRATTAASVSGGGAAPGGSGGGAAGGPLTITQTSPAPSAPPAASPPPASSSTSQTSTGSGPSANGLPPVKHVFLVVLSGQGFNEAFVHIAGDPYLAKTLVAKGELIYNYYGVTGGPLANEIAMVSGQGPTPQTVAGCPVYQNILPGTKGPHGQILGTGCVYPKSTPTLAGQLAAGHRTWRAYVQVHQRGRAAACIHPKLGSLDSLPSASNPYVTWRNPFMYFRALTPSRTCAKNNVAIAQLAKDLKQAATTPALSYIVPDACHDGSDVPCAPGAPSGMGPADSFLKSVVPKIMRSPAYKDGGLIAITFDAAPQTGPHADSSGCCNNPTYPNLPAPATATQTTTTTAPTPATTQTSTTTGTTTTAPAGTATTGTTTTGTSTTGTTTTPTTTTPIAGTIPGGGQVGLLLISRYVKRGTTNVVDSFNHFSLLASIEKLFGLKRLGYANDPAVPVFGTSVFTAPAG